MNIRIRVFGLALAVAAAPATAQDPTTSLPAVKAEAVFHVAECARRVLPSQRTVGEWTGQDNFSQVYDTRLRLMAEIGHACRQDGVDHVQVVSRDRRAPR